MQKTYIIYIFFSISAVCVFAAYQHLYVLGMAVADLSFRMYIVPSLVGGVFGYLLAKVRVLQKQLQANLKVLEEHEQQLQEEVGERKEIEKILLEKQTRLEEVNRDLEAFSYSVSHDLQAPLRSINGFSEILLDEYKTKLDEDGVDYIARIINASNKMSQLVKSLLSLSRASRYKITREEVDLKEIVRQIVDELMELHPEQDVNIEIASNMKVYADASLLRVVMNNILSNAWKFSSKKPATEIKIDATTHDNETTICIQDNGVGFNEQDMEKMFLTFQRMHSDSEFQGNGIGLATVKRIIQRHRGRIWAEPSTDGGAVFCFTLPNTPS